MQYIFWNQKTSTPSKITTKVPQGSVLGPFLFLIYSNELREYAENNNPFALFADDTSLVKGGKRKECQIQEDIDKMAVWFTSNSLL